MMNSLFKLPLHGLSCLPFCQAAPNTYIHNVHLQAKSININAPLIWEKQESGERYVSHLRLFHDFALQPANYQLKIQCQGSGVVSLNNDEISVDWDENGTDFSHYFQSFVAALWLEINNTLCIHANALALGKQAIMLVAPSQTGKTTLSLALCQQGFSLMTDDMAALHRRAEDYYIYPSWPIARIWPDTFQLTNESPSAYSKVHKNFDKRTLSSTCDNIEFSQQIKKLTTIYLLNRVENLTDVCELIELPHSQAILHLLQNSILGDAYRALNIEQSRLQALVKLVAKISFKQVNYRSGIKHVGLVAEYIKNDLH